VTESPFPLSEEKWLIAAITLTAVSIAAMVAAQVFAYLLHDFENAFYLMILAILGELGRGTCDQAAKTVAAGKR
jgi:hypothetical protein